MNISSINNSLTNLARYIGMDGAIAYTSGGRIIQGFTGVASVFFITTFLTGVEQGFYYTFGSILALQVFFELGLTGIMTQYVAHEASHLNLTSEKEYVGDNKFRSRLASLLHFCIKWYGILSFLILLFLLIVGYIYFNEYGNDQDNVEWHFPWLLICISTSINFLLSPLTSILNGLNFVKETSKIGFWQQIITPLSTWLGLACSFKLYVTGIGAIISSLIWLVYVYKHGLHKLLLNLWRIQITERVSYLKEIFPYQWRIALSWISGYFIFQLFNPVLFATEGAVVAGQMGMTMQALNSLMALTQSWINTKVPRLSALIAQKKYKELDILFITTMKQMLSIGTFLMFAFIIAIFALQHIVILYRFSERFLPMLPLVLMCWACWTMFPINCWATYLRCHKKEPLLVNSVVVGILCCISTVGLGNLYGLYGMVIGFACLRFVSLTWIYCIYKKKKYEWHNN